MNRALERFKQLCLAEQRRLSSAGGELLGVYAAARRQAPEKKKTILLGLGGSRDLPLEFGEVIMSPKNLTAPVQQGI